MGCQLCKNRKKSNKVFAQERTHSLLKTQSYEAQNSNPKLKSLLLKRQEYNDINLQDEESIELLTGLVKLVKNHLAKISGQKVLLIIGDTKSGKSSLVNFLAGCEMEKLNTKQTEIKHCYDSKIKVKKVSKKKEILEIGHSPDMPATVQSDSHWCPELKTFLVECVGHKDTLGFEINVVNSLRLMFLLKYASEARIVLNIDWNTVTMDSGQCFESAIETLEQLYGGKQEILDNMGSLLINITKADVNLSDQDIIDSISKEKSEFIQQICTRIVVLDYLDYKTFDEKPFPEGALSISEIYQEIKNLKPLKFYHENLETFMHNNDIEKLTNFSKLFKYKIVEIQDKIPDTYQDSMIVVKFPTTVITFDKTIIQSHQKVRKLLNLLEGLFIIENHDVNSCIEHTENLLVCKLKIQKIEILEKLSEGDHETARKLVENFVSIVSIYSETIKNKVGMYYIQKQILKFKNVTENRISSANEQEKEEITKSPRAFTKKLIRNGDQPNYSVMVDHLRKETNELKRIPNDFRTEILDTTPCLLSEPDRRGVEVTGFENSQSDSNKNLEAYQN